MIQNHFPEKLDDCKNFGDIFELVKRAVKLVLGQERSGLMLYLGNLPLRVGAFHQIGSNGIVMNKRLLDLTHRYSETATEVNSFVFSILLHEYLHSLGYVDEVRVRRLVYEICRGAFGPDHPVTRMAFSGPFPKIPPGELQPPSNGDLELELIRDFERSNQSYIS